jgi:uncharacterized protein YndB with AHSA1/START domain
MNDDVVRQIGAVGRTLRRGEVRNGVRVHAVTVARTYPTDVEDLWDAVTNEERLPRSFLPVSGDLREGGRYQLEGNAGGEILVCERPHRLAVTWEYAGEVSWVEVRLTAVTEAETRLELEHLVPDDDHWRTYGPGATGAGWEMALLGLSWHYSADPVDPAAAMAWMESPAGHEFIRRSSGAWGRVAVESGTPEPEAMAADARTVAFYTGADPESGGVESGGPA